MSNNRNNDLFIEFTKGLDSKLQAQLNYIYAHNMMMNELERKREMEEMERRITENVVQNVSIRIEDEAIKQLCDMINSLGK